jgi:ketosteroid isomerase-like protein
MQRPPSCWSFKAVVEQYHRAVDEFSKGDPAPVNELFSRQDDVTLANPFGPAVRGWGQLAEALDFASSRFREGEVVRFETLATHATDELACLVEVEGWTARVADRRELSRFTLRVTTTFRRERGGWKLVHRHADPIATPDPDGPLRASTV